MSLMRWNRVLALSRTALRHHNAPPRLAQARLAPTTHHNLQTRHASAAAVSRRTTERHEELEPMLLRLDEEVRKYGRITRRDLDDVVQGLQLRQHVTTSQSLLIIRCCGSLVPELNPEERTKLVNMIWNTFQAKGVHVDISHYNALLRVYIENDHDFSTQDFMKDLETKKIEPNRVTYQRIMWKLCQKGDVQGASQILEVMREKNMPLTEAVLDALVLGHVKQNNIEGARSVLTAMGSAGLSPTAHTYTILMSGPARDGNLEKVQELLSECEKQEIYLSDRDLMEVLEEFARNGHIEHVKFMLGLMQKNAGYNQDSINLILRLINAKCEDSALLVLKTLTKSSNQADVPTYQCAFYIRHLANSNLPVEKIISQCKDLFESGIAPKAYYVALDQSFIQGKVDLSLALMEALNSNNEMIRIHYFWPVFVNSYKQSGSKGVINMLNVMSDEFNITPSVETLRDYVVPYLLADQSPKKVIEILRENGTSSVSSIRSVVTYLIHQNQLKAAVDVATLYGTKSTLKSLSKSLVSALLKSNDIESFVSLVKFSYNDEITGKQLQHSTEQEVNEDNLRDAKNSLGQIISMIVGLAPNQSAILLPEVLQGFHAQGLGISAEWASRIQQRLSQNSTPEIEELLSKLSSDDLQPVSHEVNPLPPVRRNSQQLLNLISALESKGENPTRLYKQLLSTYIRSNEVERVEECKNNLLKTDFVLTGGTLCQIMDMYAQLNDLDKALEYKKQLLEKEPDFIIDKDKIIRLVKLLIQEDKFEMAIDFLDQQKSNTNDTENNFYPHSQCWQVLNILAEKGDVEKVNQLFEKLKEYNHFELSNSILGPLVKVHLVRNDLKTAVDVFEKCCREYNFTPWKSELNKRLITEEDANGLQKLTDLSTVIHGEINSLYDLVFGFIECGRLKQARKILEAPGMRSRNQRFNNICQRYSEEGKIEYLEDLLEVTRGLSHIDRTEIFQSLLKIYIENDNAEKAIGLWTLLQEENIPPTDNFLVNLAKYLQAKNMNVPFIIPEEIQAAISVKKNKTRTPQPPAVKVENVTFNANLENNIKQGNFEKVTEMICSDLKEKRPIPTRLMRYALATLAENKQIDMIEEIGKFLTEEQRATVSYNNRLCVAVSNADLSNGFFAELEEKIKTATDSEINSLTKTFPTGGVLHMLTKDPKLYEKAKNIADEYAKRGSLVPMNALWIHHVTIGSESEASDIWKTHLIKYPNIMFRGILKHAKNTGDISAIERLLTYMNTYEHLTPALIGSIRSWQIDLLVLKQRAKEANELLSVLSQEKEPVQINENTLKRLKNATSIKL